MSKSYVKELKAVYACIFQDAKYAYPTLEDELERDLTRLLAAIDARGIHVLLVDLPAVGKHLDRCLADSTYKLSGLPMTHRFSGRTVIPRFLRGLYLRIFESGGQLKGDYDVEAIFFLRQILYVAKKAKLRCSEQQEKAEVAEFVLTDASLPDPEPFWGAEAEVTKASREIYRGFTASRQIQGRVASIEDPSLRVQISDLLAKLDKVSNLVCTTLGSFKPEEWRFKHGPGAIAEVVGPYNKFHFVNWTKRLEREYPVADYGYNSYSSWAGSAESFNNFTEPMGGNAHFIGDEDTSSRMISVLKTYTKPRLIAAEPGSNMWCQQNIWRYFSTRTEETWLNRFIKFRDQTQNQLLCKRGAQDGSLATVDLSAASDRVTCHVVGQMFRVNPTLLNALQSTRTPSVTLPKSLGLDHVQIKLKKFSTMGNACTFPVETLIFLSIAIAAVLEQRGLPVTTKNVKALSGEVSVFGDDIIVPTDSRKLLCMALEVLYFKVNVPKSFWTGKFRESCGVDSYGGVDVTPTYWKMPCGSGPESIASAVETHNNFQKKWLLHTSQHLASAIRKRFKFAYVAMDSGVSGLHVFNRSHVVVGSRRRWNANLQTHEVFVPQIISKVKKVPITDDSALFQYFTEQPGPLTKWTSGVAQRPASKIKSRWLAIQEFRGQPVRAEW